MKKKNTTEYILFSYYIKNIIFSRGNLEYENEARRLYEMRELETIDIEEVKSINPYLTNNKGETARNFIQYYNNHNDKNEHIKYAIMIDDNISFVRHTFNSLNQIGISTKGFCIKLKIWNS